jgi:hypothetical protein
VRLYNCTKLVVSWLVEPEPGSPDLAPGQYMTTGGLGVTLSEFPIPVSDSWLIDPPIPSDGIHELTPLEP